MAKLNECFKNVMTYAAGIEAWVKRQLPGDPLKYTFVSDFACIDWVMGEQGVRDTYTLVKDSWLNDYIAFTEVIIALNMLSWANDQLRHQGIEDRDPYIELYSELYYQARDDFYAKYEHDEEKCHYLYKMTD